MQERYPLFAFINNFVGAAVAQLLKMTQPEVIRKWLPGQRKWASVVRSQSWHVHPSGMDMQKDLWGNKYELNIF